eukprot:scaffold30792_cov63-Phaeocystis_antarctica.AAC.3
MQQVAHTDKRRLLRVASGDDAHVHRGRGARCIRFGVFREALAHGARVPPQRVGHGILQRVRLRVGPREQPSMIEVSADAALYPVQRIAGSDVRGGRREVTQAGREGGGETRALHPDARKRAQAAPRYRVAHVAHQLLCRWQRRVGPAAVREQLVGVWSLNLPHVSLGQARDRIVVLGVRARAIIGAQGTNIVKEGLPRALDGRIYRRRAPCQRAVCAIFVAIG